MCYWPGEDAPHLLYWEEKGEEVDRKTKREKKRER